MSERNDLLNRDDVLSLEDQAWADSCFVGDSEILDSDWDFSKTALQEVDTSHLVDFPVSEIDYLASPKVGRIVDNASSDDGEEKEENGDGDMILDKIVKSKSKKTNGIYPFRTNYNEHLKENENSDLGLGLGFFDFSSDKLAEDIFKVWDLDIPTEEEDELVTKQLIPEGSSTWKDLKDGLLDDLITGISDLSLDLKSN